MSGDPDGGARLSSLRGRAGGLLAVPVARGRSGSPDLE